MLDQKCPVFGERRVRTRRLLHNRARPADGLQGRLGSRTLSQWPHSVLTMPPSLTSGSSIIVSVQNSDVDIGLRHGPKGSALPMFPQSVSRGARFSRLRWFTTAAACQVAGPPSTLPPLWVFRARTPNRAWARRAVGEGVRSCPRAGLTGSPSQRGLLLPGFRQVGRPPRRWI